MKNRYVALRIAAAAALICTVVGLSGYPTSATTSGDVPTFVPQLEMAQPLVPNRSQPC